MTEQEDLRDLLQQALPPVEDRPPGRDLWPEVLAHRQPSSDWSWLDLGAAAVALLLLLLFPECLWLLLYHL